MLMVAKKGFSNIVDILDKYQIDETKQKRISREFQDYAYRLAVELDDTAHTPIYMRIAKTTSREMIEQAKSYVLDANVRSKAKVFMWKLKQLRMEKKGKA